MQKFTTEVSKLADERCGKDFAEKIKTIRYQRERLLNNIWREDLLPERLDLLDKKNIFREIDFDTIIMHSAGYLKESDYLAFLFDVAELTVKYIQFQKGMRLLDIIVTKYRSTADKLLLAKAHHKLGNILFYRNSYNAAEKEFQSSLQLFSLLKNNDGIATSKNALGILMVEEGQLSQGESLFKEAKEIAKSEGSMHLLANTNMNIGNVYFMSGNFDDSMAYYQDALKIASKENYEDSKTRIYNSIALIHKSQNQLSEALKFIDKSIDLATKLDNKYLKALSYLLEAEIMSNQGEFSSATAIATAAFSIFSEAGDRLSMAEAYKIFGIINRENNRLDVALSYLENSRRINEEYDNHLNLAETLIEMAELYKSDGETAKALESLKAALKCFRKLEAEARIKNIQELIDTLS